MEEKRNKNIENETFLAEWLAGKLTDAELKKIVSEEDFLFYNKLINTLDGMDKLSIPKESSFEKIQQKIEIRKRIKSQKRNRNWTISIAASILVLFGLFTTFYNPVINIETTQAEQKTFQLIDGSEVVLNATSQISYDEKNWEENRLVVLNGEAFFKVEKGSKFTVNTSLGNIQVLGTQFNVNATEDYFQVTCFEGKVKVIHENKEFILTPNESFRRINGNEIEEFNISFSSPSWISGESTFKSVPLKYVIIALEKQYNIKIYANNIDDTQIYTGSFSHDNIEIAFASVFKTMNINYRKLDSKNYRLD